MILPTACGDVAKRYRRNRELEKQQHRELPKLCKLQKWGTMMLICSTTPLNRRNKAQRERGPKPRKPLLVFLTVPTMNQLLLYIAQSTRPRRLFFLCQHTASTSEDIDFGLLPPILATARSACIGSVSTTRKMYLITTLTSRPCRPVHALKITERGEPSFVSNFRTCRAKTRYSATAVKRSDIGLEEKDDFRSYNARELVDISLERKDEEAGIVWKEPAPNNWRSREIELPGLDVTFWEESAGWCPR